MTKARLKGAISPQEVLDLTKRDNAEFLEVDPQEGFSVRNFQIQAAKMAMVSDVVVYGDVSVNDEDVLDLAKKIATAQGTWRVKNRFVDDEDAPNYNTFVLSSTSSDTGGDSTALYLTNIRLVRRSRRNTSAPNSC